MNHIHDIKTAEEEKLKNHCYSSQTKFYKRRRNKILYKQAITQRFHRHQAHFTRAPERSTKHRKEQPVPATPKMYQMVKSIDTMKKLHQLTGKTTS